MVMMPTISARKEKLPRSVRQSPSLSQNKKPRDENVERYNSSEGLGAIPISLSIEIVPDDKIRKKLSHSRLSRTTDIGAKNPSHRQVLAVASNVDTDPMQNPIQSVKKQAKKFPYTAELDKSFGLAPIEPRVSTTDKTHELTAKFESMVNEFLSEQINEANLLQLCTLMMKLKKLSLDGLDKKTIKDLVFSLTQEFDDKKTLSAGNIKRLKDMVKNLNQYLSIGSECTVIEEAEPEVCIDTSTKQKSKYKRKPGISGWLEWIDRILRMKGKKVASKSDDKLFSTPKQPTQKLHPIKNQNELEKEWVQEQNYIAKKNSAYRAAERRAIQLGFPSEATINIILKEELEKVGLKMQILDHSGVDDWIEVQNILNLTKGRPVAEKIYFEAGHAGLQSYHPDGVLFVRVVQGGELQIGICMTKTDLTDLERAFPTQRIEIIWGGKRMKINMEDEEPITITQGNTEVPAVFLKAVRMEYQGQRARELARNTAATLLAPDLDEVGIEGFKKWLSGTML